MERPGHSNSNNDDTKVTRDLQSNGNSLMGQLATLINSRCLIQILQCLLGHTTAVKAANHVLRNIVRDACAPHSRRGVMCCSKRSRNPVYR